MEKCTDLALGTPTQYKYNTTARKKGREDSAVPPEIRNVKSSGKINKKLKENLVVQQTQDWWKFDYNLHILA